MTELNIKWTNEQNPLTEELSKLSTHDRKYILSSSDLEKLITIMILKIDKDRYMCEVDWMNYIRSTCFIFERHCNLTFTKNVRRTSVYTDYMDDVEMMYFNRNNLLRYKDVIIFLDTLNDYDLSDIIRAVDYIATIDMKYYETI